MNPLYSKNASNLNNDLSDVDSFQNSVTSNWVFAINFEKIILIEIFVKIDEILVNAADNY